MDFTRRKLPKQAINDLRIAPIASVKPYAPMLAPVYVYMKLNEKFVSVKAPLDFFLPEELERFQGFESFFFPAFVEASLFHRKAARAVRALLSWEPHAEITEQGEVTLPPAPYELSDAVLRIVGTLWGSGPDGALEIEPFFVAVFANELCDLLPEDVLKESREASVDTYEKALLQSAWAVFLALHLGYCELGFLNRLRLRVFNEVSKGLSSSPRRSEIDELLVMVKDTMESLDQSFISGARFAGRDERVFQKIVSKVRRVKELIASAGKPRPTIRGPGGFLDV